MQLSKVFIVKLYYFILFIMQGPHAITSWNAFWMLNAGLHFIYMLAMMKSCYYS